MLTMRRLIALSLGGLFVVAALVAFLAFQASGTLLDADFYTGQARQAAVFEYTYDELAPLGVRDIAERNPDLGVDIVGPSPQVIASLRQIFPPEWLYQQTEMSVAEILPYIAGEVDEFTVAIPIADRILAAGPVLKEAIRDPELQGFMYNDIVANWTDSVLTGSNVPFGIGFTAEEVQEAFRNIAPPEWLTAQFDDIIDELLPYLAGQTDTFAVTIPLRERTEVAATEIKRILAGKDLSSYVTDTIAGPGITRQLVDQVGVPFALVVTPEDLQLIASQVLTPEWTNALIANVVDELTAYITGASETFSVDIQLADRKTAVLGSIVSVVDLRLSDAYAAAPVCTSEQLATLNFASFASTGITCRPAGVSLDAIKTLAGVDNFNQQVRTIVGDFVPDSMTFTEADLRRSLSTSQGQVLDDLRSLVINGIQYNQADLELLLTRLDRPSGAIAWSRLDAVAREQAVADSDLVRRFNDIRGDAQTGFTFTQADLLNALGTNGNAATVDRFEQVRQWLGTARSYEYAGWAALALLLVAVGWIGGRRLPTKVAYSAVFLTIAALIVFVAAGPVWDHYAGNQIVQLIEDARASSLNGQTALEVSALDKMQSIAEGATSEFSNRLAGSALLFLIVGVASLVGSMVWLRLRGPYPDEIWDTSVDAAAS
ncbi:MAG: hypothetical protein IIC82_06290 [Chloroflexi bacterium]|nr:hypothetical protein [Chloroflexota bacterium]